MDLTLKLWLWWALLKFHLKQATCKHTWVTKQYHTPAGGDEGWSDQHCWKCGAWRQVEE